MAELLAVFPRERGIELRVFRAEADGRKYVSLKVFEGDAPIRNLGLRWSEAIALGEVLRKLTAPEPADETPRYVPKATRPEARNDHPHPPVQTSRVPFDECKSEEAKS